MAPSRWGRPIRASIAIACALGILAMMWLPAPSGAALVPGIDKVVHVGSFFVLALVWQWAGLRPAWVLGLGTALAGLTEYGQGFLPWPRTPDLIDMLADVAGLVGGVVAWPVWRWFRQRRTPPD